MVTIALELIFYGVMLAAMILFYGWLVTPFVMIKIFIYAKIFTKNILRVTGNFLAVLFSVYLVWASIWLATTMFVDDKKMKLVSVAERFDGVLNKIAFGRISLVETFIENLDGTSKIEFVIMICMALSLTGVVVLFAVIVACYANYPYIIAALLIDGVILLVKYISKNESISVDKEDAQAFFKKKIPNPFSRFFHRGKSKNADKSAETSC